ncbi:porin family protein [Psychroserpens sp. SPM9]|uniref:porin family protein n=1 Tax=Psychroserpens sp. SPM9 TaxID=2975598 RepID=UPI0021A5810B|nr:porin family protein [Psychroserpens sp. SPM9]MDG5490783.1 porin family protein [Psychroserpens sp. SPM9]
MKHLIFYVLLILPIINGFAQEDTNPLAETPKNDSIAVVDHQYKEDQFYLAITYNLLGQKPDGVSQNGFSSGFHLGFIKDMPINTQRNIAIGLGLGLSSNSYNQTLLITEENGDYIYTDIDDDTSFSKNKFTTYLLEMPIEFRWRTSTPKDYDFWRIYTGFKIGYVFHNSSKFNGSPNDIKLSNIDDFNAFQYGLTFSAGYSNVNFHFYYALNTIFDTNAKVSGTGEAVDMNAIKIGLIFYIL